MQSTDSLQSRQYADSTVVHPARGYGVDVRPGADGAGSVASDPIQRAKAFPAASSRISKGELSPGPDVATDEQILEWVAKDAETALHPSCTCKMGVGDGAVVDPTSMRVHGVDGLRVVDASVFPFVTNANIYAPVAMTAEKSADLILGNTPLEPLNVEYYKHG